MQSLAANEAGALARPCCSGSWELYLVVTGSRGVGLEADTASILLGMYKVPLSISNACHGIARASAAAAWPAAPGKLPAVHVLDLH